MRFLFIIVFHLNTYSIEARITNPKYPSLDECKAAIPGVRQKAAALNISPDYIGCKRIFRIGR